MTKLKNFNQFLLENKETPNSFVPEYFSLPYSIPEDRFEGGLLKKSSIRRGKVARDLPKANAKYSGVKEFFAKNTMAEIEKKVLAEIDRVVKFISNNPLTGKAVDSSFSQESSLEEYLSAVNAGEDVSFGTIDTNLPFSTFSIRVDYDVYKNIPVFTFWYSGDLFYYYTIFTLDQNDVIGSGEFHTYITADEVIKDLFYESVWRSAFYDISQMRIDSKDIGFSESEFERLVELADSPNYPKRIVKNYFDKEFIKLLKNWIEEGEIVKLNSSSNTIRLPERGNLVSVPYSDGRVIPAEYVNRFGTHATILLPMEENKYLAIRLLHPPDLTKISSILTGEYVTGTSMAAVDWKPLSQDEVHKLHFIDKKGNPIWFQKFMNS